MDTNLDSDIIYLPLATHTITFEFTNSHPQKKCNCNVTDLLPLSVQSCTIAYCCRVGHSLLIHNLSPHISTLIVTTQYRKQQLKLTNIPRGINKLIYKGYYGSCTLKSAYQIGHIGTIEHNLYGMTYMRCTEFIADLYHRYFESHHDWRHYLPRTLKKLVVQHTPIDLWYHTTTSTVESNTAAIGALISADYAPIGITHINTMINFAEKISDESRRNSYIMRCDNLPITLRRCDSHFGCAVEIHIPTSSYIIHRNIVKCKYRTVVGYHLWSLHTVPYY
jgi:hypothetical protein